MRAAPPRGPRTPRRSTRTRWPPAPPRIAGARGGPPGGPGDAEAIDAHTRAVGPARDRGCGGGPDRALLDLRARAVPASATTASVRLAARLSDRARVQFAKLYGLSEFPREVSLWG